MKYHELLRLSKKKTDIFFNNSNNFRVTIYFSLIHTLVLVFFLFSIIIIIITISP